MRTALQGILGGLFLGLMIGLVPFLAGLVLNRTRNGIGGMLLTMFGALLFGALGAVVAALGATLIIVAERMATPALGPFATKTCPRCAEEIKAAAQVCRFCGYEF